MPIDPVCGVYVDEDEAVTANFRGKSYYFCCDDCKEEFLEAPDEYVGDLTTEAMSEDI